MDNEKQTEKYLWFIFLQLMGLSFHRLYLRTSWPLCSVWMFVGKLKYLYKKIIDSIIFKESLVKTKQVSF